MPQLPGMIDGLVLPTRGEYRWTYQEIHFPARGDGINQGEQTSIDISDTAAVASKTMLNANGKCEALGGILAGPAFQVANGGALTLTAGERVVLRDGFSVASGGRLAARVDPALAGGPSEADWTYAIPVAGATNRLSNPAGGQTVAYDAAGNLTSWNGQSYNYDPFGMAWRIHTGVTESLHLYTADDERFWTYQASGSRWTLRDLDGKVLREYSSGPAGWQVERDYVYRDGQLLAAVSPADGKIYHYHPDHLGSPRLITNQNGQTEGPYGEEATSSTQDDERMKFTGHERDLGVGWSTADDLDYHHARYYNFRLGRYASPDKLRQAMVSPQSWNLYSYARSNPLAFVDPKGLYIVVPGAKSVKEAEQELHALQAALREINQDQAADQLKLIMVDGEVRVVSGGSDLSQSSVPSVRLLGRAIATDVRITFDVTNENLGGWGGALTDSVGPRKNPGQISIFINPGQVATTRVPGRFIGGRFTGRTGDIGITLGTGRGS